MHPTTLTVTKVSIVALAFAVLGAISVGYVAAQTASSTEPLEPAVPEEPAVVEQPAVTDAGTIASSSPAAETSPEDSPASDAEPQDPQGVEQASTTPEENTSSGGGTPPADTGTSPPTTEGEVLGASDTEVATSTPEETEEPEPVIAPPGADPLSMSTTISIATLQDAYFGEHESYLQILPGNQLPEHDTGTVAEKLGQTIDPGARVDVYENVYGKGYQITFEENGIFYSAGYGPEAHDRTFTYTLPIMAASSTEAAIPLE